MLRLTPAHRDRLISHFVKTAGAHIHSGGFPVPVGKNSIFISHLWEEVVRKFIFLLLCLPFISGCATFNPYFSQYQELEQAYKDGKLTTIEYFQLKQNLQAQELQWRTNYMKVITSSPTPVYQDNTQGIFNQQLQQMQQQQMDYYKNLPKTTQTHCQTYCNNYGNCQTMCY